ncbi:MAG: alpha/beta hydrolase [Ilumatobacteraceae bacterium]
MKLPWLPPGHTAVLDGRGEIFYRHHQHSDPAAPIVLLLHGWTASADLQFYTAYEELARHVSFIAVDHRGHGRSMRPAEPFELEDAADDAAILLRQLGITSVIAVGYSMGGPITLLLNKRHPELVAGIVVEATALEWRATFRERVMWKTVRMLGPVMRSWASPVWLRTGLKRLVRQQDALAPYVEWLAGEISRNSAVHLVHAGQALGRYDSMLWASTLGTPSAMLITTADRLVKPRKQRQLAAAINAHVLEIDGDHLAPWVNPVEFSTVTTALVQHVAGAIELQMVDVEAIEAV